MSPVKGHITGFLLDDHEIVRRGVADLLDAEHDIRVIGQAATEGLTNRQIAERLYLAGRRSRTT
jgi:DNA-binding NarL/FixJ family response regulator